MKCNSVSLAIIAAAMLAGLSSPSSAADEGAALYKKKCAHCHGQEGQGKPSMKAPELKSTSFSEEKLTDHITKGEPGSKHPHNKGISGISEEHAQAIAEFVKNLK